PFRTLDQRGRCTGSRHRHHWRPCGITEPATEPRPIDPERVDVHGRRRPSRVREAVVHPNVGARVLRRRRTRRTGARLMRRLGGLDAAFLYGETPSWHMHVCALLVVDPAGAPDGYSFERIRDVTLSRLPQMPQFRWRLHDVPLGL